MHKFAFLRGCLKGVLVALYIVSAAFAGDEAGKQIVGRLRDPDARKVPCGLYLSDLANSVNGTKVADPTPESVLAFFDENPDLIPKLAYREAATTKPYKTAADLKAGITNGNSEPYVNEVELSWVGLPHWGKETRELIELTEKKLQEKYPDIKIKVRHLWRPNREMSSLPSYLAQELMYLFPSPKLDYQPPIPSEKNTAYSKLAISNGSQQIFLFFTKPWFIAVASGAVNFANSYYTGVYRKFFSNWSNRSLTSPTRWMRNIMLSAFFTSDLYWAGRGFYGITSAQDWADFAADKWASTAFGVLWRYFYGQSIVRWEGEYKGHPADARRMAASLEFLGTFLTTPAFIYSASPGVKSLVDVSIAGHKIMGLNAGHFGMIAVALISMPFYYKFLSWDPMIKQLDRFNAFNRRWASAVGLVKLSNYFGQALDYGNSIRWTWKTGWMRAKKGELAGEPLNGNVNDAIDLDKELVKWIQSDPDLQDVINRDPDLRDLIEKDSHFDGIRDQILKPNQ